KRSLGETLHKLWVGTALRCPNCEQGRMFDGLMRMRRHCDVCDVRFERQSGESVGGMYLNLGLAELTAIPGFFIVKALFEPPFLPHLLFWLAYTLVFCLLFYRHARGMWVSISYLSGGVQTDSDYLRDNPMQSLKPASNAETEPHQSA